MTDKIDLDAIINNMVINPERNSFNATKVNLHNIMKEAIHQALVLASEKAKLEYRRGSSDEENDQAVHISSDRSIGFIYYIDKQSILDVEKLIV